ncbi:MULTISPECIES: molybdopterin-dependent oxidoreductase [unclassified Methanoregula]|uniref:molybdopterin-dependent oxidoreductase n=1 Tax=unclassified Methanoregula TaxID=2649730 RepID=UPI0009CCD48A|nr:MULTISPECIES: molybdopterin-dependent oxidoreductase [unclassified Methanoregula]OPX64692.1 MAG: TMAO/DMSO reductase [Methanoregula sp. PtaB.Bin085]OPY36060.1 MAG: TMAO/DMSO reductase [Methanoregula sp. PtaU1.Bin006]
MKSGQTLLAAAVIIIAMIGIILVGIPRPVLQPGGGPPAPLPGGGPAPLPAVEIRSYQGEDLSPINDFRENSIKGPQYINRSDYRLTVTGLTNSTDVYTYDEVLGQYPNYTKVVTLHCVEGWDVTILWEGILVRDLIRHAGVDPRANTVIFRARDGYTTSFPLAYVMDNQILMAYRMNNMTLPAERGYPFQLVAEDKWGYKWIKWIEEIELTGNADYRGYWEQRGYSNTADLNRSFFF